MIKWSLFWIFVIIFGLIMGFDKIKEEGCKKSEPQINPESDVDANRQI